MAPALTLLVLTEDTSASAHQTWVTLLKKSFGILVEGKRLRCVPLLVDDDFALGAHQWP